MAENIYLYIYLYLVGGACTLVLVIIDDSFDDYNWVDCILLWPIVLIIRIIKGVIRVCKTIKE